MWRYYLQKVLYSVKAGRLFLFLCDYVHINIYINSLKLTNVTMRHPATGNDMVGAWKPGDSDKVISSDRERHGGCMEAW